MKWLDLKHKTTGGSTRVPDEPGVREWHEARGWEVVDPPAEKPFVPAPNGGQEASPASWVTMNHPGLAGVSHDFPDNPEALSGALEAGWRFPPDPDLAPAAESKDKPVSKKSPATPAADNVEKENV